MRAKWENLEGNGRNTNRGKDVSFPQQGRRQETAQRSHEPRRCTHVVFFGLLCSHAQRTQSVRALLAMAELAGNGAVMQPPGTPRSRSRSCGVNNRIGERAACTVHISDTSSDLTLYTDMPTPLRRIILKWVSNIWDKNAWEGFMWLNPLKPELNPICYLLALLGAHHFLHVSRIRVKLLNLR